MNEHPKLYPIHEVVAELYAAQSEGQRFARYRCQTCNAHFISPRDALNHNVSIYGPGYHVIVEDK